MTISTDIAPHGVALSALRAYSDNPSGFYALNEPNEYFTAAGIDGVVAYRPAGRYLLQFGGAFAAGPDRPLLQRRFLDEAARRRRRVIAVQLQREDATLLAGMGFAANQFGASYALELDAFTLRGSRFMRLRNKISRARRAGLEVVAATPQDYAGAIAAVDARWLRGKGRHVKELDFLIGQLGGAHQPLRRLFVGLLAGEPIAYISYAPVYGSRPGWLHDLTRRVPQTPPGVMEAINVHAIEALRAGRGVAADPRPEWLHFGMTPFTSLREEFQLDGASPMVDGVVRLLARHGHAIYPARTQIAYKEKWGDLTVLPDYLAFPGRPSPRAVWTVMRVTRAI